MVEGRQQIFQTPRATRSPRHSLSCALLVRKQPQTPQVGGCVPTELYSPKQLASQIWPRGPLEGPHRCPAPARPWGSTSVPTHASSPGALQAGAGRGRLTPEQGQRGAELGTADPGICTALHLPAVSGTLRREAPRPQGGRVVGATCLPSSRAGWSPLLRTPSPGSVPTLLSPPLQLPQGSLWLSALPLPASSRTRLLSDVARATRDARDPTSPNPQASPSRGRGAGRAAQGARWKGPAPCPGSLGGS